MKRFFPILSILSVLAILAVAGAAIIEVPEAIGRNISVIVGGSPPSSGPAPGTLLLGLNSDAGDVFNGNPNTAYSYCHTGQATATVANAYFYDHIGLETDPVHVCIWNSSGTLLGCSGNITMGDSAGWRSVAWSGPSIQSGSSYFIGAVSGTTTGFWTASDESSPSLPATTASTSMTFGSEGNLDSGDGQSCTAGYGNMAIYVTN